MKLKRAIAIAVITYVLSFVIGLASIFFVESDVPMTELPTAYYVIGIVISVVLATIFSLVYFRKVKPSAKEGFYFGLVLLVVGFVMDIIIFFLGSLSSESAMGIFDYYSNIFFWIALVLLLITTTIVGAIKAKRR